MSPFLYLCRLKYILLPLFKLNFKEIKAFYNLTIYQIISKKKKNKIKVCENLMINFKIRRE